MAVRMFGKHLFLRSRLTVKADDLETRGIVAIAQNARPFTYFGEREIDLSETAGLENRSLALTVLDRANPLDFAPLATRLLTPNTDIADNRHIKLVPRLPARRDHQAQARRPEDRAAGRRRLHR